ncbi:hypothetical protein U0070_026200 [Myodes glareolus]|uniref:G-protein coupled receptors family 1 profile domain-containing protein n=1 Tax=Myodes glareolus TaxID=447135 RepID=A0AAW0GYX4_MYOGA
MENKTEVTQFILMGLTNDPDLQLPLFITFLLIYTITLVGNLGMFLLTLLDSRLHTPMYIFLCNLSFVDFCYSSTVTPKVIAGFLTGDKIISYNACASQMFFFANFAIVEHYLLVSMAYDRYVAVSVMILSCSDRHVNELVLIYVASFNIFFALIHIIISYMFIFTNILKMNSVAAYYKALSTFASHFTAVSIFYGTVIFMYLQPSSSHSMDSDQIASVFYTMFIPMLNPLVYSLRNKEVKSAFTKIVLKSR